MQTTTLEYQILSRLRRLDKEEKQKILEYLKMRLPKRHSGQSYKRKALRQIRKALGKKPDC